MNLPDGEAVERSSRAVAVLLVEDQEGELFRARELVAESLRAAALGSLVADARLIVSELLSNALLHAGAPARLVVRLVPGGARLEVSDASSTLPIRTLPAEEEMTGRGLRVVEGLARDWGAERTSDGKVVWALLSTNGTIAARPSPGELGPALDASAAAGRQPGSVAASAESRFVVRLGDVPVGLLLSAKAHVDNLVREFALARAGARSGSTAAVPGHLTELIEGVVTKFADARQAIKRQAVAAAEAGLDHVRLELELPVSSAAAGKDYLRALDEVDSYCRAARLLTLESPPQHRLFRQWYVGEIIDQLRHAAAGETPHPPESFEQRLLAEIGRVAAAERANERAARLHSLSAALTGALTAESVADAVLRDGVASLGASGGGLLLADDSPTLVVPGTVGYDAAVVARLRSEPRDAELPAAVALRTGQPVWVESRDERDSRFPELTRLEPGTVSMCAVPLELGARRLGAVRFSFNQARLFDADERSFIITMARLTAQALDRAQLYDQRVDAARRLQQTLLPPQLPVIPGAHVAAAYHPAAGAVDVGGDFYDVWECGDRRWGIAIGDVSGKGPGAAAMTALVRYTLRASTMAGVDLATTLERVDREFERARMGPRDERFFTVLAGMLTMGHAEARLELASGGHYGPIVLRAGGEVEDVVMAGSLLGLLGRPTIDVRTLALNPGDEILLYTDGVTEARRNGLFFGVDGVVVAAAAGRAAGIPAVEAVERAVVRHSGADLRDDIAMLGIRFGTVPGVRASGVGPAAAAGEPAQRSGAGADGGQLGA
ncbi:MAG TPA: SpoIIE family protein phosphatase [Egibacteraceae bacterium]|nr:SpoIIE family protein phosphatase [Egibacteraceae bacterium]